jgi:hypothetical protein
MDRKNLYLQELQWDQTKAEQVKNDLSTNGWARIPTLLGKTQVADMLEVAGHNLTGNLEQGQLPLSLTIDGDQADIPWSAADLLLMRPYPPSPEHTNKWLQTMEDPRIQQLKSGILETLQCAIAPIAAPVFGCDSDMIGPVENFSCLYMLNERHKHQQWHLDMRSPARLVLFVGLQDACPRVQFFSEHYPAVTAAIWSETPDCKRAGNIGEVNMKTYAIALATRHLNKELLPDDEKIEKGDIILMFANVLHRGPAKSRMGHKRRRAKNAPMWHRLVAFGTIGPKGAQKYDTSDQPLGTICLAEACGVGHILWCHELWLLLSEGNTHAASSCGTLRAHNLAQYVEQAFNSKEYKSFADFWAKAKPQIERLARRRDANSSDLNEKKLWKEFGQNVLQSGCSSDLKECVQDVLKQRFNLRK